MSNSSLTADAIEGSIIANYVSFSTSALYIYEYLIVIDQEIALVWKAKWKLSTLLFLVNRYVALMVALVYTVPVVDYTTQASCNAGVNLLKTATLVQFLVIAVFSTQRVFAVTSRTEYKYWLSALVFALGIVPIIVNVWTVAQEQLIYVPKSACTSFVVGYDEVLLRLAFATRASAILADILVIIFIIRHNWAFYVKTKGIQLMGNTNLCQTMLFDGTIYFLAMLIINVFFALDNTLPYFKGLPPVISMVQSIPPILTSRMLLHLREAADARAGPLNDSNDHWATAPLQFADPASGRCKVTKDIVDLSEKDMESIEFENVTMEDGTPESREVDTDEQAISEVPRSESRC